MKKFIWKQIEHRNEGEIGHTLSILEVFTDNSFRFWGSVSLYPTPEWGYQFVAFGKERVLMTPNAIAASIDEAKESIENFLMSQDVILEGDEVGYE